MTRRNLLLVLATTIVSVLCYERAARSRYVATLAEALRIVEREYVEEVDTRVLFEGAMQGMVGQLDAHSSYIRPDDYQKFAESMTQEFGGIGILVDFDTTTGRLTVMNPMVGTPAYNAGLKQGDVILAIDGRDTAELKVDESLKAIRGPIGTEVQLTILHLGEATPREHKLERARIVTDSVYGDVRRPDDKWDFHLQENPRLGLIRIGTFGERTAEEMQQALATYREPGAEIDALLLDLRGNSGGLLKSAVAICDLFLDEGVVVSTRGRGGVLLDERRAQPGVEFDRAKPIIVLVDRFSASASEIVAACLQDHGRARICGERTWGKGTVQNLVELEGRRSALRITTATYWRPSGKNIHKMQGDTEEEEWGVSPEPALAVSLDNDQLTQRIRDRRRRDFPNLPESTPSEDTPASPASDPDASAAANKAPYDDPQLCRAIDALTTPKAKATEPEEAPSL